jgi:hypothetical protein
MKTEKLLKKVKVMVITVEVTTTRPISHIRMWAKDWVNQSLVMIAGVKKVHCTVKSKKK